MEKHKYYSASGKNCMWVNMTSLLKVLLCETLILVDDYNVLIRERIFMASLAMNPQRLWKNNNHSDKDTEMRHINGAIEKQLQRQSDSYH